jgi:hypothetical protein
MHACLRVDAVKHTSRLYLAVLAWHKPCAGSNNATTSRQQQTPAEQDRLPSMLADITAPYLKCCVGIVDLAGCTWFQDMLHKPCAYSNQNRLQTAATAQ